MEYKRRRKQKGIVAGCKGVYKHVISILAHNSNVSTISFSFSKESVVEKNIQRKKIIFEIFIYFSGCVRNMMINMVKRDWHGH